MTPTRPTLTFPTVMPRSREDTTPTFASVARDRAWFRATYYAWCARKETPLGRFDPATGEPYRLMDMGARMIGRAAYLAAAREAYKLASMYRMPLP